MNLDILRHELGIPEYVPRRPQGIGAQDGDIVDMTDVTEWAEDEPAPLYEAGTLYADARRGAAVMRRRAFGNRHAQDLYPTGIFYTLASEDRRGCPSW